jgi:hypothetical protein
MMNRNGHGKKQIWLLLGNICLEGLWLTTRNLSGELAAEFKPITFQIQNWSNSHYSMTLSPQQQSRLTAKQTTALLVNIKHMM